METELERLSAELCDVRDRQQIGEALYTYCRAVDRVDRALGHSIWHADAEVDYGTIYRGPAHGLIEHICDAHLKGIVHSHQVTNILIRLAGDSASSEAYVTSAMRMVEGEVTQITTRGRYLDNWLREDGRWLIRRRFFVLDLNERGPVTPSATPPRFTLDRDDPSYRELDVPF